MFRFQHTEYLLALAAVPLMLLLYFLVLRWKRKTIRKIGDERLVKTMIRNYSPGRFAIKFVLFTLAFIAGAVALANLRTPQGMQKVNRSGIDVMIALDVSNSMLAQDVKPNRLERAKQVLGKLIDRLGNDRVGIVVFAGKAYLQMPLTGDNGAAKMYLAASSPDIVPTQGTVIGDALKMCYASFNAKEKKYKAVVLISDGEDHDENAIEVAGQMADEGIVINTVGIGSPDGAPILDPLTRDLKKDLQGNTVISRLNEEVLQKVAEKGNGLYQLFSNTDRVVANLDEQLKTMDQRTVTEDSLVNYESFFPYFLGLMLLLLVLEFFIAERKKMKAVKQMNTAFKANPAFASLLLLFLIPAPLFAQTDKQVIRTGNEAYKKGEFDKAAEEYKKAAVTDPADPVAQYNLGNALYRSKKIDEAIGAYDVAAKNAVSDIDKGKAYYNKGVVLQNNKKIPECITAYKNALKLNPDDEDARQNLQKALRQQKEENDKKDDDKKDQKKPKDDPKKEQQKPQPAKISKQDAEEKLKALLQQEKNLQDKLRKVGSASPNRPEKDW